MKRFLLIGALFVAAATPLRAALYWQAGVRGAQPTVCFAGNASTAQPARVAQIKETLRRFEEVATIRFVFHDTCTNTPQPNGNDFFLEDIRVAIPGTSYPGVSGDLFNALSPIPGKGCPVLNETGSSWSNPPSELELKRACVFNLHLGNDNFVDSVPKGDPSGGSTPYVNHTLHEFGHALGLSHEHERYDFPKEKLLGFYQQIASVDSTKAQAIYDKDYRSVQELIDADVAALQQISGFSSLADASALKSNAQMAKANGVPTAGGKGKSYLTTYDRLSVMHYTWEQLKAFAPGNYSNGGLSDLDRLALHILYPESNRVAEFVGTRVIRTTDALRLGSQWQSAGATIDLAAKNFVWKLDGATRSTTTSLDTSLTSPGTYALNLGYTDLLGRTYSYTGEVRVLTPTDYARRIAAPIAAQLPLM